MFQRLSIMIDIIAPMKIAIKKPLHNHFFISPSPLSERRLSNLGISKLMCQVVDNPQIIEEELNGSYSPSKGEGQGQALAVFIEWR